MNEESRHKFIWGWLRLFLGWLQMSLAATGVLLLVAIGLRPLTLVVFAATVLATVTSLLLYRRRPDPMIKKGDQPD